MTTTVYVLIGYVDYESDDILDIYTHKETRDAEYDRLVKEMEENNSKRYPDKKCILYDGYIKKDWVLNETIRTVDHTKHLKG